MADAAHHDHQRAVSRVYGPETWEVYDVLDRSLDPRGPEVMLALAIERLTPASVVLDVGCRDASISLTRPKALAPSRKARAAKRCEGNVDAPGNERPC